jgi:anthraniloyl-CoA monooxygenase
MKVDIIGGGPGGLYFSILAKKAWPAMHITVYERNRADDTFGFGVVFSDETLETVREIRSRKLSRHHGEFRLLGRHRNPFQGDGAPHRRQRLLRLRARDLLKLLHERAHALGVD